jgi:hypothetical protein
VHTYICTHTHKIDLTESYIYIYTQLLFRRLIIISYAISFRLTFRLGSMLPEIHQELRSGKHISGHSDRVLAQNFDAILAGIVIRVGDTTFAKKCQGKHWLASGRGDVIWSLSPFDLSQPVPPTSVNVSLHLGSESAPLDSGVRHLIPSPTSKLYGSD